jgi:hypothetical protein
MAITFGKVERIIEIPTGNWTCTLHETMDLSDDLETRLNAGEGSFISSGYSRDSGAGNAFLAKLKAALDTAGGKTYTVSIGAGENGTGKVTISADTGNFAITWVSTDLRDLLGFTQGNVSGAGTYTGASQVKSLWLPDTPMVSLFGAGDAGFYESDAMSTESPGGYVKAIYSNKKQVNEIRWDGVTHAKCRLSAETTTNASFETFWVDSIIAEAAWAVAPGGVLRFYWNADADGAYTDYKAAGTVLSTFNPTQMTEGWLGLWNILFDRLVVVP